MSIFYQEEQSHQSKRCKFLATLLKEAFLHCHSFNGQLSNSDPDDEHSPSDIDDESEVVVSEIRSRAMEKIKRRKNFTWVLSPSTREFYINSKHVERRDDGNEDDEFFSVGSCLSLCSSCVSTEAFTSARMDFSRCLSLKNVDFPKIWKMDFHDFRRLAMIREFCHCEGWPFGLCRKAVLLTPLPKSPSESWSWLKGTKLAKVPYT